MSKTVRRVVLNALILQHVLHAKADGFFTTMSALRLALVERLPLVSLECVTLVQLVALNATIFPRASYANLDGFFS